MNYLLSSACLPNAEYMSIILLGGTVWIEAAETFQKQSYRNRTMIQSPNGIQVLSVPVCRDTRHNVPVREIRISDDHPWQRMHWRSLESCYRSSPYFEFFEHQLRPFYEKPQTSLFDYNLEWMLALCRMMGVKDPDIRLTEDYIQPQEAAGAGLIDLRGLIHPKKEALSQSAPYTQLFAPEGVFIPRLSFADLLFNEGRNSINWLNSSFREINNTYNPHQQ